jgi:hypothetical protein
VLFRVFLALHPALLWASETVLDRVSIREERTLLPRAADQTEFPGRSLTVDPQGESSLTRLLSRSLGVAVQKNGGDESFGGAVLRGQDPVQSRTFLNSIPMTDALFNQSNLGWLPVEALERMDLFPEGIPAAYGGDGLGGAIALSLLPPERGGNFIGSRLGSLGAMRVFGRGVNKQLLPASLFLEVSRASEDFWYRDSNSTPLFSDDDEMRQRSNNGQQHVTILPQVNFLKTGEDRVDAMSFHTVRRNEIPGSVGLESGGVLRTDFHLVSLQGEHWPSPESFFGWSAFGSLGSSEFTGATELAALQTGGARTGQAGIGGRYRLTPTAGPVSFQLGASAYLEGAEIFSIGSKRLEVRRVTLPLGLSADVKLSKGWTLKPAVFLQAETSRPLWDVSPRLGLEVALGRNSQFRLLGGRFFRFPTLAETHGAPSRIAPNLALRPERAWKAEVGLDTQTRIAGFLAEFSATLSGSLAEDLIVLQSHSQSSFIAQNVGLSQIVSPELGVQFSRNGRWGLKLQASGLFSENLTPIPAYFGKWLPMRPRYRGGLELEWKGDAWKVSYSLLATGALFADSANSRSVGSYLEHGLWGSWSKKGFGVWLLELRNLTDATMVAGQEWNYSLNQNVTGLSGFPSPGRRVYLTWRTSL